MTFASCTKEGREKGREGEGKLSFYISMTTEVMGSTSRRGGKKKIKKNPALLICSYVKTVIKMCLKFKHLQVEKKAGDCRKQILRNTNFGQFFLIKGHISCISIPQKVTALHERQNTIENTFVAYCCRFIWSSINTNYIISETAV